MRKFKFEKLVRDKIVEDIIANGHEPKWKILKQKEYIKELKKKVFEEAKEVEKANDKEVFMEIADVQEIVDNLISALGKSKKDLREAQKIKNSKRGLFKKKHYIDHVEVEDGAEVLKFYLSHSDKYPEIK